MMKARPLFGWLVLAVIVGLELWAVCSWYGDHAGGSAGSVSIAETGTPGLTAPFPMW